MRRQGYEVLLLLFLLQGCSSVPVVLPPPSVRISLYSDHTSNDGQPFYLMVQKTTQQEFLLDDYDKIAARVFAAPKDPLVIESRIIYPGKKQSFSILEPAKDDLGVYFMFTKPQDPWKLLISKPFNDIDLQLLSHRIQAYDPSFLQRVGAFSVGVLSQLWSWMTFS